MDGKQRTVIGGEGERCMTSKDCLIPDLPGHPLTLDEYHELTPEKLELVEGYVLGPAAHVARHKLLAALLKNEGLVHVVRLAPAAKWLQALTIAYPEHEGC